VCEIFPNPESGQRLKVDLNAENVLTLNQAVTNLINAAIVIQKIAHSMSPAPVANDATTSKAADYPDSPRSPTHHCDLGDYPSEHTVWDIEAALILFNMKHGTSLSVADYVAANSLIDLSGNADQQVADNPRSASGANEGEKVSATPSVEQPKRPKLVSHDMSSDEQDRLSHCERC